MISKETCLKLYEMSFLIRTVDEKIEEGLRQHEFFALHYPVKGQELISASLGLNHQPGDRLISTYRCLGDLIASGGSYYAYFAEIMGKKDGISGGKGGCMHLCSPENGLLATTGIVGGGLPIACGAALSLSEASDNIVVTTFGDGATTTGAYHESMNLAGLWHLPVLFVCINNGYALHTRLSRITGNTSLHTKIASYGFPAFHAEANNADHLYTMISACSARVRRNREPLFLEISCPRRHGHMAGSTTDYMHLPPESESVQTEPLMLLRDKIIRFYDCAREVCTTEERIRHEVSSAYDKAHLASFPSAEDLFCETTGNTER